MSKNTNTRQSSLCDVLSSNLRDAIYSFTMLKMLFFDNTKDIPFTTNLFSGETIFILYKSLFANMISSTGRLMDKNKSSASIPSAMRIIRSYKPTAKHVDDLWRYDLTNWKYDFEKQDIDLVEPTNTDRENILKDYFDGVNELHPLYEELCAGYRPIKMWRDKEIAHTDNTYADGTKILDGIPRQDLEEFFANLESLVGKLCSKLYQTKIETSIEPAKKAASQLIEYAYTDQLARVLIRYIDNHSPQKEADIKLFYSYYCRQWNNGEAAQLVQRALEKRDEIKKKILSKTGFVTGSEIDDH